MEPITYEQALAEIEAIAEQLEAGQCDIDKLPATIQRAKTLLTLCRNKLHHANQELTTILTEA